jgi:ubiquinone/menaquinone biosynthesis C-methylase UbiE
MICADIEALPFVDKAFEFVLCHQTIEHVDDPDKACSELVRVGQAGHVTAPCEAVTISDYVQGRRPYHKWLVKQEPHATYGTRLRFVPVEKVLQYQSPGYADRHVIMFWIGEFTWEVES